MQETLVPIATFCGNCDCGCPQLFLDADAPEEQRVRITDDFGQRIQMSREQFADLLAQAKSGALDATALDTAAVDAAAVPA